jgi:hypothetical protein
MMKTFSILLIGVTVFLFACNKADTGMPLPKQNFADTAETIASLDSTSFGVYKAVLAGNTGRVKIYINNGDTIVKAYLSLDSLRDTLTCLQPFTPGQAISNAVFTGRISGFYLSADADGNNAVIENIIATGHSHAAGVVAHENSDRPVYCYEAPFTGTEKGNFNFIRYGSTVAGVAVSNSGRMYSGTGLITGNIFLIQMNGTSVTTATFQGGLDTTGDYYSGSWVVDANMSGVFNGKRTL